MDSNKQVVPPGLDGVKASLQKFADYQQGRTESSEKNDSKTYLPSDHFEISIITPMFGGSATAGKVNLRNPVRASSVRGHLRFWWRATIGASINNVVDLRKREVQVFGDAGTPSSVKIWVEDQGRPHFDNAKQEKKQRGKDNAPKKYVIKHEYPLYVTFPFAENNEVDRVETVTSHQFKLHITYKDASGNFAEDTNSTTIQQEVHAAVWAWINFGGIGSRTRRGCGSLYSRTFSPTENDNIDEWYAKCIRQYKLELSSSSLQWPTLPDTISYQDKLSTCTEAWKHNIKNYQNFRQNRNIKVGKIEEGESREGRSFWPEPDALRIITKMFLSAPKHDHRKNFPNEKSDFIAFPRAEFGLPIIFQFKGTTPYKFKDFNTRDPYTIQITPKGANRLSSPMILKALAVSPSQARSIVMKLHTPRLEAIELKISSNNGRRKISPEEQEHTEIVKSRIQSYGSIDNSEIYKKLNYNQSPYQQHTSAIDAFLEGILNNQGDHRWKKSLTLAQWQESAKSLHNLEGLKEPSEQEKVDLDVLRGKYNIRDKKKRNT